MANIYYKDPTQWKISPMAWLTFQFTGSTDSHGFWLLEKGSKVSINAITRSQGDGCPRTVGYKLEGQALIIPDNLGDMQPTIEKLSNVVATGLYIHFTPINGQPNGGDMDMSIYDGLGAAVANFSAKIDIITKDTNLQLQVSFTGFLSVDVMSEANFATFIAQYWT